MTLIEQIGRDIAAAMKSRDAGRLTALRMLKTALTNKEVEKGRALDGAEALQVVASLVKQRRDSIEQFTAAGRTELAAREQAEITVLETYLPPEATPADVEAAVEAAVAGTGATGPKDMGKVMKAVMAALEGLSVDGRRVSETVRKRLGG
jgi:uncharacterized protein YqeY